MQAILGLRALSCLQPAMRWSSAYSPFVQFVRPTGPSSGQQLAAQGLLRCPIAAPQSSKQRWCWAMKRSWLKSGKREMTSSAASDHGPLWLQVWVKAMWPTVSQLQLGLTHPLQTTGDGVGVGVGVAVAIAAATALSTAAAAAAAATSSSRCRSIPLSSEGPP